MHNKRISDGQETSISDNDMMEETRIIHTKSSWRIMEQLITINVINNAIQPIPHQIIIRLKIDKNDDKLLHKWLNQKGYRLLTATDLIRKLPSCHDNNW